MTKAATLTQANIARAIRAAEATGKVAVMTRVGLAFIDPAYIIPAKGEETPAPGGNTCDSLFGVQSCD